MLRIPRLISEQFVRSRLARRVFGLVVACALVPLALFAVVTQLQVGDEIRARAEALVRHEAKMSGVIFYERLIVLLSDMRTLASDLRTRGGVDAASLSQELSELWRARVTSLGVGSSDGYSRAFIGARFSLPEFDAAQRQHLARGPELLVLRPGNVTNPLQLVMTFDDARRGRCYLVAEPSPAFIWNPDGWFTPDSAVAVMSPSGAGLFTSVDDPPPTTVMAQAIEKDPSQGALAFGDGDRAEVGAYRTLFLEPHLGTNLLIVQHRPVRDIEAPLSSFRFWFIQVATLALLGVAFASSKMIRRILAPVDQLLAATQRVAQKDFESRVAITSRDELGDLGRSFNEMTASLARHENVMTAVNDIGSTLGRTRDPASMIEQIVGAGATLFNADGAAVYLNGSDGVLGLARMRIASLDLTIAGNSPEAERLETGACSRVLHSIVSVEDVYRQDPVAFEPQRKLDEVLGYHTRSLLNVPMRDHEGELIGVLRLFNARNPETGEVVTFSGEALQLAESLAAQAAIAVTNNKLVAEFKNLFDSLIQLLAVAIDEKSPYTGGHCRRVPEITMLIADAVSRTATGPFREVSFSPDELYELKVAALLHDCGKVATPVHVVDKATKLETIHDRIELVDTRFEVVRRDLELRALGEVRRESRSGESGRAPSARHEEAIRQLESDRAFLRKANIGSEFMTAEHRERVRDISRRYRWRNVAGEEVDFLTADEIENLTIPKGTLNQTEREIINLHVTSTIRMLQALPYPRALRRVPEIAGAHHERMDGKGYPHGLRRDDISLQGRILGLADIFEALTAKDRPYKPGKKLSEVMTIMGHMANEGHVDRDLFRLFVEQRVYLDYARSMLDPEQVDAVDVARIPSLEQPEFAFS